MAVLLLHNTTYHYQALYQRISSDKASNLRNETFVLFVEITTGETKHIQQIYIDEPSMHHDSRICIFKTGFRINQVSTLVNEFILSSSIL